MVYKDYFSEQARVYARARPDYPDSLFRFIASKSEGRRTAWDCATGNGQAARSLSPLFKEVIASDASSAQIAEAHGQDNIRFAVFPAEAPAIEAGSVDLITVAQALHWLNIPRFMAVSDRVLRDGGLLACWCYTLCSVDDDIDRVVNDFYNETVGPYWPPERALVDSRYAEVEFPWASIVTPDFAMSKAWQAEQMLSYMASWSATQRYRKACGEDPMPAMAERLNALWPAGQERTVTWPLSVVLCRKSS